MAFVIRERTVNSLMIFKLISCLKMNKKNKRQKWTIKLISLQTKDKFFLATKTTLTTGTIKSCKKLLTIMRTIICLMWQVTKYVLIFFMQLKTGSMGGCGCVPMDTSVNINTACLRIMSFKDRRLRRKKL